MVPGPEEEHWKPLVRARAVENTPCCCRWHRADGVRAQHGGRPMGVVVASLAGEGVAVAAVDPAGRGVRALNPVLGFGVSPWRRNTPCDPAPVRSPFHTKIAVCNSGFDYSELTTLSSRSQF